jgi:hypothetical protein
VNATAIALTAMPAIASPAGGIAKPAGAPAMHRDTRRFGLALSAHRLIGLSEMAAATGLILGLLWWPIGGLVCLMAGAVIAHRRAGDPPGKTAAPAVIAALAVAAA